MDRLQCNGDYTMGVQFRQNTKTLQHKGVIATMSRTKQPAAARTQKAAMSDAALAEATSATAILRALADLYEAIAERLLDRIHDRPRDRKQAQTLSRHLDWVGARAQMVGSFLQAGDCAMTYICASADAQRRLMPLIKLAAQQLGKPGRLSVALYLAERIDEELRLV
jgi:gamma-glutamyl:cysteine ligase YbdK (ATP-grasp superfamily)